MLVIFSNKQCQPKISHMCLEWNHITESKTTMTPSLISQENYKALRVVAWEPHKRGKEGFVVLQIETHRTEWNIISYKGFTLICHGINEM